MTRMLAVVVVLAAACSIDHPDRSGDAGASDAATKPASGARADAGHASDGDAANSCQPRVSRRIAWKDYGSADYPAPSALVWSGERIVGVWANDGAPDRVTPHGVLVSDIDPVGANSVRTRVVWDDQTDDIRPDRLATSNGVLAAVYQGRELDGARGTCRFGLVRLSDLESIQAPTRYSDPPAAETILHEASSCDVAALGDGFVLLWQQYVDDRDGNQSVFAQRIGTDGSARGERLTLYEGSTKYWFKGLAASLGDRVAVGVVPNPSDPGKLVFIEESSFSSTALEHPDKRTSEPIQQLMAAHGGFLARSLSAAWVLDRDGHTIAGPAKADFETRIAPLGDGYVQIAHPEYLTATTLSSKLDSPSAPLALSDDRDTTALDLIADPSGELATLVHYGSSGDLTFVVLGCGDTPAEPLGPQVCPADASPKLLDDGCTDDVCHGVIRFDYLTLGVRGWAVTGAAASETNAARAAEIAGTEFSANNEYGPNEAMITGPFAGMYRAYVSPSDFGAIAAIGAKSGAITFSGGVVWSGHGAVWTPATWNPGSDLACGETAVQPAETFMEENATTACPPYEKTKPAAIADALAAALRSNLAASLAKHGPVSAYAFLYTPSVGGCDPGVAEYVVILTAQRE